MDLKKIRKKQPRGFVCTMDTAYEGSKPCVWKRCFVGDTVHGAPFQDDIISKWRYIVIYTFDCVVTPWYHSMSLKDATFV